MKYIFIFRHRVDPQEKEVCCYDVDMVKKDTIHEAQLYGESKMGTEDIFVGALEKGKLRALYCQGKKVQNKKLLNEIKQKLGL